MDEPPVHSDASSTPRHGTHAGSESAQLVVLRSAGFSADFEVGEGGLMLVGVGPVDAMGVHIDAEFRFEGASDPDDESVVLGLHDPASGARGVLVSAYGPAASASEAEVLSTLALNPSCA
jgi:hypothetical protein